MKKVVFRVDSSSQIGLGHVMRCLTLAGQLKKAADITFICRDLAGNIASVVQDNGFDVYLLNGKDKGRLSGYEQLLGVGAAFDAQETAELLRSKFAMPLDCLVVDQYALGASWEKELRPYAQKVMAIDDLANREHDCDILLDQNCAIKARYEKLVPRECQLFLGTRFFLLREEFYAAREALKQRDGSIKNIFVFFGGGDAGQDTMKALKAIKRLKRTDIKINVVVGAGNINKDNMRLFCQKAGMEFYCQINCITRLMNEADLAIGAGGTTSWERCFLGLPSLVVSIAENQTGGCEALHQAGCIDYLGENKDVTEETILLALQKYLAEPDKLKTMGEVCLRASDFGREGQTELVESILA